MAACHQTFRKYISKTNQAQQYVQKVRLPDFDPEGREPDTWLPQPGIKNKPLDLVPKITKNDMFCFVKVPGGMYW